MLEALSFNSTGPKVNTARKYSASMRHVFSRQEDGPLQEVYQVQVVQDYY